jgi:hypothetical protein
MMPRHPSVPNLISAIVGLNSWLLASGPENWEEAKDLDATINSGVCRAVLVTIQGPATSNLTLNQLFEPFLV